LRITNYRRVDKGEGFWVDRNCTVVECDESPGGRIEFAILHASDLEKFVDLVRGEPPPT
jgi:hypothetical protein